MLSPLLFVFYMDHILATLGNEGVGVAITSSTGTAIIPAIMYMDDLELMAHSLTDLARLFRAIIGIAPEMGIVVSKSKSTILSASNAHLQEGVSPSDFGLPGEFKRQSKYLGGMIMPKLSSAHAHITRRICIARSALSSLSDKGLSEGWSQPREAFFLIPRLILPTLMYGVAPSGSTHGG